MPRLFRGSVISVKISSRVWFLAWKLRSTCRNNFIIFIRISILFFFGLIRQTYDTATNRSFPFFVLQNYIASKNDAKYEVIFADELATPKMVIVDKIHRAL